MNRFIAMTAADRRLYFEQAVAMLNLPAQSIEKDFWVCWTLRELFSLPEIGNHLTFKGGSSLSKAWKLIERFSEDIDVVIDRDFLGFGGEASPADAPSRKKQKRGLEDLKVACQKYIRDILQPSFSLHLHEVLPQGLTWSLAPTGVDEDPDMQTLLFRYPSVAAGSGGYIIPQVRIELGARSDTEPHASPSIEPYLAEAFPSIFESSTFLIRTVAPERTFWEKAMLLHEENLRPKSGNRKPRLARHFYDLWCLITKGVSGKAMSDLGLFEKIAQHRKIFFRQNWVDYDTLRPGSFRLVPPDDQYAVWRNDYLAMQEMIFGEIPAFDQVIKVVGDFERRLNGGN